MLKVYATPLALRDAYTAVVILLQGSNEDEQVFEGRLRRASQRAGNILTDKTLCNIYMDGPNPAVPGMIKEF